MVLKTTKKSIDGLCFKIICAAIDVHKELGMDQPDGVYSCCLKHELTSRGLSLQTDFFVPVEYKSERLSAKLMVDFLVEGQVVIAIKSDTLVSAHTSQLLKYLRLLSAPKGILLNFSCENLFHQGQKTIVNQHYQALP